MLWLEVQTQWRISFGVRTGLDMAAVKAIAELLQIELTPPTYKILRGLEMHLLQQMPAKD